MTASTGLRARAGHLFLTSGRTQLVTDALGMLTGSGNEGLFVDNTRILASEEVLLDEQPILTFVASLAGRGALHAYAIAAPSDNVPERSLYVEISRRVDVGLHSRFRFHNFGSAAARPALKLVLRGDFADTEETHKGTRQQEAPVTPEWDGAARELTLRYQHEKLDRAAVVVVAESPGAVTYSDGALVVDLDVAPKSSVDVVYRVEPVVGGVRGLPGTGLHGQVADVPSLQRRLRERAPVLTTTNATVARAWATAVDDLSSLPLGLPAGPAAPGAGLPLYQYLFGRDSLTISWQALMALPDMAGDALRVNAAHQGVAIDDWRDEEPGKMTHQARSGPVSALGRNPFSEYFGDYAAAQDFLILLGQRLAWTGDVHLTQQLLGPARAAIEWLERFGDLDGDGLLEYEARSKHGVKNQGWKDSPDAIVDERGEIVPDPIATCEIQAYWYVGLRQAALAFLRAGDRAYAFELLRKAKALKRRIDEAFWMPDEQYYALALDPEKRQVRSIASNAGHLLAAGVVPQTKAAAVVDRLTAPDMFSGWGVRTLSAAHPSYNPFSYHLGSVWPVDAGTFALGFVRYGQVAAMHRLAESFFSATELFNGRLPESLGGLARDGERPHPGIYPESNEPQGWSASAVVLVVQAILGLRPFAPLGLLLVDPHLPAWLPDLKLEGIRVGDAVVDVEAHRAPGGRTRAAWRVREGSLRVLRQPPPQAPMCNPARRLLAAAEGTFE